MNAYNIKEMNDTPGIITTLLFATIAWVDHLEQWMRIGASAVAILAGLAVIIKHVIGFIEAKKKKKIREEKKKKFS